MLRPCGPGPLECGRNRGLTSRPVIMNTDFPHLFSPLTMKNVTLR